MLDTFTLRTFAPLVGGTFELTAGEADERVAFELVEASAAGAATPGAARDPFSLAFLGPVEPLLAQATYSVSHPTLGAFELFVVPVGRDADGVRYEAVFT